MSMKAIIGRVDEDTEAEESENWSHYGYDEAVVVGSYVAMVTRN